MVSRVCDRVGPVLSRDQSNQNILNLYWTRNASPTHFGHVPDAVLKYRSSAAKECRHGKLSIISRKRGLCSSYPPSSQSIHTSWGKTSAVVKISRWSFKKGPPMQRRFARREGVYGESARCPCHTVRPNGATADMGAEPEINSNRAVGEHWALTNSHY